MGKVCGTFLVAVFALMLTAMAVVHRDRGDVWMGFFNLLLGGAAITYLIHRRP